MWKMSFRYFLSLITFSYKIQKKTKKQNEYIKNPGDTDTSYSPKFVITFVKKKKEKVFVM